MHSMMISSNFRPSRAKGTKATGNHKCRLYCYYKVVKNAIN
jgi:hypothetical protein